LAQYNSHTIKSEVLDIDLSEAYLHRIRIDRIRSKELRKVIAMTSKVLFTGKTHNTGGRDGGTRSSDGLLNLKLSQPHPAAENLFGAAWSACYIGALELAAAQRKVTLPTLPAVDTEIDLVLDSGSYFLQARLNVSIPGIDREVAQALIDAAHGICPYSKATHGNINVETNLL
jgi:Ohr subfamily peroxiredoxin